jgi:hypothetical protein
MSTDAFSAAAEPFRIARSKLRSLPVLSFILLLTVKGLDCKGGKMDACLFVCSTDGLLLDSVFAASRPYYRIIIIILCIDFRTILEDSGYRGRYTCLFFGRLTLYYYYYFIGYKNEECHKNCHLFRLSEKKMENCGSD